MMKIDRMKRLMAVPLLGMVFSTALFGQDTTKAAPEKMVTRMMTIQFGYANMGNSTLRQFYQSVGDELNQNYWTFGLASTSEYKRFITGATLQGGMTQPVTIKNYGGT
ncbi:MAG: hypothetical protein K2Q22_10530, partial [Cytophagales bacterium]|nr:hypothetical protein [Cytophagales bacterium]